MSVQDPRLTLASAFTTHLGETPDRSIMLEETEALATVESPGSPDSLQQGLELGLSLFCLWLEN